MRLSALTIRNAKPRETPYKLGDGGGLYLLIQPKSTCLWRIDLSEADPKAEPGLGALP